MKSMKRPFFYRKLLVSYIAVFVTILFISSLSFISMYRLAKKQEITLIKSNLETISKMTDLNISNILLRSSYIQEHILSLPKDYDLSSSADFQNILKQEKNAPFVDIAFLYSQKDDSFITDSGVYDPYLWYYSAFATADSDFDRWYSTISSIGTDGFDFTNYIMLHNSYQEIKGLFYRKTIVKGNDIYVLYYVIKGSVFLNISDPNDDILVYNNERIFTVNPIDSKIDFNIDELLYGDHTNIFGVKRQIVSSISASYPFTFIHIVPPTFRQAALQSFFYTLLIYLIVSILALFLLSDYYTKKNYKPIKKMLDTFPKIEKTDQDTDEFSLVSSVMNNIILENQSLLLDSQNRLSRLHSVVLKQLLTKNIVGKDGILEALSKNDITFKNPYLYIVVFVPTAQDEHHIEESVMPSLTEYMVRSLLDSKFPYYFTEIDKNAVFVINSPTLLHNEISKLIEELKQFSQNMFDINISAAVSGYAKNPTELANLYSECLTKLSVGAQKNSYVVQFDSEYLSSIINYIKSGQGTMANMMLEVALVSNFYYGIKKDELKNSLSDILSIILSNTDSGSLKYIDDFMQMDDIDQSVSYMNWLIKETSKKFSDVSKTAAVAILESLPQQVSKKYMNLDFSVSSLGQYYGKTPSYISKLFYGAYNVKLNEYIALYRINLSIKLLLTTDMSIKSISQQTGFVNSNVFIRTFKKFTNFTPLQYRTDNA